jgi:hypothetical protein
MTRVGTILVAIGVFSLALPVAAEAPPSVGFPSSAPASQPASAGSPEDVAIDPPVTDAAIPEETSADSTGHDSPETGASSQPAELQVSPEGPAAPSTMPAEPSESSASSQPATSAAPQEDDDDSSAVDPQAGAAATAPDVGSSVPLALPADVAERRLVAFVAAGVATVALGAGISLGVLAQQRYDCLADVVACNQTLEEPIVGDAFLEARADVETLSLLADMSYVLAAGSALVAVTSFIRGYLLPIDTDEVTP